MVKLLCFIFMVGIVTAFPITPEEFKLWLCSTEGTSCDLDTKEDGKGVWKALIKKMHHLGLHHTTSHEGMRSAFRHFHSDEEIADPHMNRLIEETIRRHKIHDPVELAHKIQQGAPFKPPGSKKNPYFGFLPKFETNLRVNRGIYSWKGPCFNHSYAQASLSPDEQKVIVEFVVSDPLHAKCHDLYLLSTTVSMNFKGFSKSGKSKFEIHTGRMTAAEKVDLMNKGIRVFTFSDDIIQLFFDLLNTASMFLEPLTHLKPDQNSLHHNVYFMEKYTQIEKKYQPRDSTIVDVPEEYINSGDFFGVLRFDGLDPMLCWAMGSTVGHTVVALRDKEGQLHICESTAKDVYWQHNGVQCSKYKWWVKHAAEAHYNVVLIPLKKELHKKFNITAAWDFFHRTEGLDYGYVNLLFGWIDTIKDNYPCVPNEDGVGLNLDKCLRWEFIEPTLAFIEKLIPISSIVFSQAFNNRLGSKDLPFPDLYQLATIKGIPTEKIPTMTELDSFNYKLTRNGKSTSISTAQVCCVFVCNLWKAGGLFGDLTNSINCGEQTNYDDYSFQIFDDSVVGEARPKICKDRDPDNRYCQITGGYKIGLHNANKRKLYAHIDETCPSMSPDYNRSSTC